MIYNKLLALIFLILNFYHNRQIYAAIILF